ncbi:MAG: DUF6125 family protein [Desulfohalobiaceae bacterium]
MAKGYQAPEEMEQQELVQYVLDMLHRIVVHHVFWYKEVEHQLGTAQAMKILEKAYPFSLERQMKRLSRELGFGMQDNLPQPLLEMSRDKLLSLLDAVAKNWLTNDGIWFLSVEESYGMNDAKRCNDTCWAYYSPFEAWSIKRLLQLPEYPGISGLKQALNFRMYARINVQSIIEEGEGCIQFQMNDCQVQSARKRKGLPDYPCKSVGLVEYGYFATAIDSRIQTECIGCPPDEHPEDWFCAWRFRIPE